MEVEAKVVDNLLALRSLAYPFLVKFQPETAPAELNLR